MVYAENSAHIYSDFICVEANVYLCIEETSQVILMNVTPMLKTTECLSAARDVEYLAIDASPYGIFKKNGGRLSFNDINAGFLDNRATVILGRNGYGYSAVYLCIN